jgi:hypothetical protein
MSGNGSLLPNVHEMQQSLMANKSKHGAGGRSYTVPSLSQLCLLTICAKIERYPPEAFSMLSPVEWDTVIERRWQATAPKKKKTGMGPANPLGNALLAKNTLATTVNPKGGLDGTGRMIPSLNAQCLREIESVNGHLAESDVADRLVWKDCVEYTFQIGSGDFGRPKPLRLPWPFLIKSLQDAGQSFVECWQFCAEHRDDGMLNDEDTWTKQKQEMQRALHTLNDAHMTITLLTESGIGKVVSKLVKLMKKRKERAGSEDSLSLTEAYMLFEDGGGGSSHSFQASRQSTVPLVNAHRQKSECPLIRLEELLDGWKVLASAKGVNNVSRTSSPSPVSSSKSVVDAISGQGRRTSDGQHRKDIAKGQKCHTWRQLYVALDARKEAMKTNMSAKLRKTRQDLDTEQLKTKSCFTVGRRSGGPSRIESILSKERGTRALTAAAARGTRSLESASGSKNKMSLLRAETQVQASFSKGGANKTSRLHSMTEAPASRFGSSIATSGPKKRGAGEVAFGGGKKMRLPEMQNVNKAKKGMQMTKEIKNKGTRGAFMKRR